MDIPRACNAATWFVDRHVAEGRAGRLAIRCGGRDITYGEVRAGANRCGNALRGSVSAWSNACCCCWPTVPSSCTRFGVR